MVLQKHLMEMKNLPKKKLKKAQQNEKIQAYIAQSESQAPETAN
jgi:hypothetical protein